jgi:hypothetical protein
VSDEHSTATSSIEFMRQFRELIDRLLRDLPSANGSGPLLLDALEEHLGVAPDRLAVVTEPVPEHRLVDADIALEEVADRDCAHRLVGLGGGDMRHHMSFSDLLQQARASQQIPLAQVDYLQAATGPGSGEQRNVVALGMRLFTYEGHPVAVRQTAARPHFGRPEGGLDVLAADRAVAEALLVEVRALMDERSVFRGKVVTFSGDPYGRGIAGVTFVERPRLAETDVILPLGLLDRVSHHVLGIAEQRERLRAHGQHLKRGVLLYGPPGTGKIHTMRYLLSASPGTTAVLLSGGALQHIQAAAKVARAHQPAIVVLEDCDLIADDRSMGMGGPKPLLFEVLDALDGLDSDADVAFLLTTNRVADLERALAQRPGRVDLAVEIPLPDRAGRLDLLRLYAQGLFTEEGLGAATERSEGTTASFAKELVRRAVLRAALEDAEPADEHLTGALDDLLSDTESLTRSLLGVDAAGPPGPAASGSYPPRRSRSSPMSFGV